MKSRDLLAVLIRLGDFLPLLDALLLRSTVTPHASSSTINSDTNGSSSGDDDNGMVTILELGAGYGVALSQLKLRVPLARCVGLNKNKYDQQVQLTPHHFKLSSVPSSSSLSTDVSMTRSDSDSKLSDEQLRAYRTALITSLQPAKLTAPLTPQQAMIQYIYGDMSTIELPSSSVSFIYSIYSIGFVYDKAAVLDECYRVLRPDGGQLRVELGNERSMVMSHVPGEGDMMVDTYGMVDLRSLPTEMWPPKIKSASLETTTSTPSLPIGVIPLREWFIHCCARCPHQTDWDDGVTPMLATCTCHQQPYVCGRTDIRRMRDGLKGHRYLKLTKHVSSNSSPPTTATSSSSRELKTSTSGSSGDVNRLGFSDTVTLVRDKCTILPDGWIMSWYVAKLPSLSPSPPPSSSTTTTTVVAASMSSSTVVVGATLPA